MHLTTITVRGYELDSYGHVNNAVYLQYYEQARWEMMNHSGILDRMTVEGISVVVVETYVRYMREAKLFDELRIESTIKAEAPYLVFYQKIINTRTTTPVSRAKIKTVIVDKSRIPQDIPAFLLEKKE